MGIGSNLRKLAFELNIPRVVVIRFYAEWKRKGGRKPTNRELKEAFKEALSDYVERGQYRQSSVRSRGKLPRLV